MFGQQLKAELTRADQERDAADETTDTCILLANILVNCRMFMK